MAKESPVLIANGVNKSVTASRRKRTTSTNSSSRSRQKKRVPKGKNPKKKFGLPAWLRWILGGVTAIAFLAVFYYFFIRPYAYRWKPCYGQKAYGVCLPYGFEVHGFDVSHHQGKINWNELVKTQYTPFPIRFVFLKASEGGDFSDTTFAYNFAEARSHGFIRGAYHYYNPKTDAGRQADFFIRSVKLEPGDLPPVLDIETRSDDMDKLRRDLLVWLNRIETYYHVKPILYTSYKYKTHYLNDSIFNTYPYWIAHYYVDSVEYKGPWKFWQHTDVGTLPGIRERVDLNVFNGSLEELRKMTIPADTER